MASREAAEYALSKDDVGSCMMFIYTPVNIEGSVQTYMICSREVG